jgi:hypothetical protein
VFESDTELTEEEEESDCHAYIIKRKMELALLILKIKLKSLSTKLVIQRIFNNNTKAVLPSIYIRSSSHLQYNHSEYPKRRGKKERLFPPQPA